MKAQIAYEDMTPVELLTIFELLCENKGLIGRRENLEKVRLLLLRKMTHPADPEVGAEGMGE